MKNIEQRVLWESPKLPSDFKDKLTTSVGKGTQGYTQWSKVLEELGAELCNKQIVSCATTLYAYNEALQLYEDLRLCDAQKHLTQFFEKKQRGEDNHTDTWLNKTFETAMAEIEQYIHQHGKLVNPKLLTLCNYILTIYQENKDSKVILFTTTRLHTIALTDWLKENRSLRKYVKPGRLVGSHSSDDLGKNQIKVRKLSLFLHRFSINIIFSLFWCYTVPVQRQCKDLQNIFEKLLYRISYSIFYAITIEIQQTIVVITIEN